MADKPIATPLPADLPENWQAGQIVAPTGEEVNLSHQHGYNYLMEMVNKAQRGVNAVNDAFESVSGKRTCRYVVGTSAAGWTQADCDFLCDGTNDDVWIRFALQSMRSAGGKLILLDGTYHIKHYIAIPENCVLQGCGSGTVLLRETESGYSNSLYKMNPIIVLSNYASIADLTVKAAVDISDSAQIECYGGCSVVNVTFSGDIGDGYTGMGICVGEGLSRGNLISNCRFDHLGLCVGMHVQSNFAIIEGCFVAIGVGYFVKTINDPPEGTSNSVGLLSIVMNRAQYSTVKIEYTQSEILIADNVLYGIEIASTSIISKANSKNLIIGNIFNSTDSIKLGAYTEGWFIMGNQLSTVTDQGTNNIIRFNSNDTSSGGGTVAGVTRFNGRQGAVLPQSGDYTAAMVGAIPASQVQTVQALTQAEYDALGTKSASTLYLIKE